MTAAGGMYDTRKVSGLEVYIEEWTKPCPECADTQVEVRVTSEGKNVLCLTCGRLRLRSRDDANGRGIPKENSRIHSRADRNETIRQLRLEGFSTGEIASQVGLHPATVVMVLRRFPEALVGRRYSRYDSSDVLRAFLEFRDETGRWPTWDEWCKPGHKPSGSVVVRCFGTWSKAIAAAKEEACET